MTLKLKPDRVLISDKPFWLCKNISWMFSWRLPFPQCVRSMETDHRLNYLNSKLVLLVTDLVENHLI